MGEEAKLGRGWEDAMDATMAKRIAKHRSFDPRRDLCPDAEYEEFSTGPLGLATGKGRQRERQRHREGEGGRERERERGRGGTTPAQAQEREREKERQAEVGRYLAAERAQRKCRRCLGDGGGGGGGGCVRASDVIAIAQTAYLALDPQAPTPSSGSSRWGGRPNPSINPRIVGHCVIAPIDHVPSLRVCDDTTAEEVRNFKKALVRVYAEEGRRAIFLELATKLGHPR